MAAYFFVSLHEKTCETMKRVLMMIAVVAAFATQISAQSAFGERPKLVVGIVVDQMRWDYLSRYYNQFTNMGFRRLIDDGFSCNNCQINYVPTVTAIGHASAYTGASPAFHGICGNNFYIDGRKVYCTKDTTVDVVGTDNQEKGQMSPRNMLSTTIGDQLRLHNDFRSKVVGVSYKDRAAIFPAGHSANAAYWLDTKRLCFYTSTYYMKELPDYVKQVNDALQKNEEVQKAGERIGFTPLCGTIITDMAIAALEGERLGQGDATDMLCVSYSETDVIGHEWGTRGERTDAAYLTLDKDLKRLFDTLDKQVGKGQWVAFLTADHGAAHNWRFMREHHLPGGPLWSDLGKDLANYLKETLGVEKKVIGDIMDYRIFLNYKEMESEEEIEDVKDAIVSYVKTLPEYVTAVRFDQVRHEALPERLAEQIAKGYYAGRAGDIVMIPKPHYYSSWKEAPKGQTTHGEWNPYDAHIPCLFLGWKIPHGATSREVHITDIAPTICQLLHIQQPSACIGEAITEITK